MSDEQEEPITFTIHEDPNTLDQGISGEYDTLVLSGGSIQGIIMLGAIQYMYENNRLSNISTYIGTSAGAMTSYLLAIGYTPVEIITYICTHQIMERLRQFNVVAMLSGNGATSFSTIHEHLEKMTIEKIGKLITLGELKTLFGRTLVCMTHNKTQDCVEMLSHETYPEMPCLVAIRMSSNLPLIFEDFKYNNSFYIDGGISNNFAIDIADKIGQKVLGVYMDTPTSPQTTITNEHNILEYIYHLMFIPVRQNTIHKVNCASNKCTVISLKPDDTLFFNFALDTRTKLEMFSNGFSQMKCATISS